MLTKNDELQMQLLMQERTDFKYIIEKLKEENQYTLSQISHEIRNPVTLINSSLQLIENQHPEIKEYNFWAETMDDIKYLRSLLDELSTFNNGERLSSKNLSIHDFLSSISTSLEIYLNRKSIQLVLEIQDSLPCICADEIKLHQAISNLVRNAAEAIENNGKIILRSYSDKQFLFIEVEDNGCGIKSEDLETIFSPFITHKKSGSGLGLAITKRIVAAHAGTIQVESTPKKGTVFTISLPCR